MSGETDLRIAHEAVRIFLLLARVPIPRLDNLDGKDVETIGHLVNLSITDVVASDPLFTVRYELYELLSTAINQWSTIGHDLEMANKAKSVYREQMLKIDMRQVPKGSKLEHVYECLYNMLLADFQYPLNFWINNFGQSMVHYQRIFLTMDLPKPLTGDLLSCQ